MKKRNVMHGMTSAMASMLVLSIGVTGIMDAHSMELNTRLGTSNYKLVEKEGEAGSDGSYFDSEFSDLGDLIHAKEALAEEIAGEGCVLLKNQEHNLPLDVEKEKITLWGLNSHNPTLGGMIGSSTAYSKDSGQKCYDLETALTEKGFELNQEMISFYSGEEAASYARKNGHGLLPSFGMSYAYSESYKLGEMPASLYTDKVLKSADDTSAVIVISRDSSEAADYHPNMKNGTEGDSFVRPLALSEYERDMIALAKEHNNGKVIVLINVDNPVEIEELKQDPEIDSILWTGIPGMYGFLGAADVLAGLSPSGHLPDTYAVSTVSAPAMVNFGLYTYSNYSASDHPELTEIHKGDWYVVESEGIYTGYKYYETRYEDLILGQGNADASEGTVDASSWSYEKEVTYPFGYGLSYTTFSRKLETVTYEIGGEGSAEVTVTNTGDVPGKETVQLYVQTPYIEGGLEKPSVSLIGFAKTKELQPGESGAVTVTFDPRYMASYDQNLVKEDGTTGAWVLDEGKYYFTVSNGAHEAINNILAAKLGNEEKLIQVSEEEEINSENVIIAEQTYDSETYSENVQNALEDCNLNYFLENKVEYTTRTDWAKGWNPTEEITPTEEMMVRLTNSYYQFTENHAETPVIWGAQNGTQMIDLMEVDEDGNYAGIPEFDDPKWNQLLDQVTLEETMAFLETGGEVIPSINFPETFRNDGPLGFTFDQVGGYSVRWSPEQETEATYVSPENPYALYAMNVMPTEPVVAATFNAELVEREGELMGEDSLWANENSILAPGLNLHRNPYCSRNHEYYSEDPMLTNILGTVLCVGGSSKGLMMEPKHFAFNHQELNRSGVSTYFDEQGGRENELRAFQGACMSNAAQGIMTGFNRAGAVFSGASEGLQVQILRKEWGYQGWIATDMINGPDYMNWRDVIMGGGGTCLTDSAYESSEIGKMNSHLDEIQKDEQFQEKMKLALKYWTYASLKSNTMNGFTSNAGYVYVRTWWQWTMLGLDCVFGILTILFAVLYLLVLRKEKQK